MPAVRFLTFLMAAVVACAPALYAQKKDALGWLEKVRLSPGDIVLTAKLDSGADSSSLNASGLREFERQGRKWVSFEISDRNGQKTILERPVVRTAMVKRRFGKPETRPVVSLGICVGGHFMETNVNLVDRANFENQLLLGRSFMAGNVTVDPAITFTSDPQCPKNSIP